MPNASETLDGIYICYFSAQFGTSLGMFTFINGRVVGADIGGGIYNGHLEVSDDGQFAEGEIEIRMEAGGITITGAQSDLPVSYETPVRLSLPLDKQPYHTIHTINGAVNVRFEKKVPL